MPCRNHIDVLEGTRLCSRCGAEFCTDCLVDMQGVPYCATCKAEQLLDIRSGVDRTLLDYASIGRRFLAQILDGFILAIPMMFIAFVMVGVMAVTKNMNPGLFNLWYLFPASIGIVYNALMLISRGQTVGKIALKIKVVNADGTDITKGQAWGREVTRALLNFLYIVDYIPVFFTNERTTLHDMAARTRVVNWN